MKRESDSAELFQAEMIAQNVTYPRNHCANNRVPLLNTDFNEHDADDTVGLVPASHIGLPGRRRQRIHDFAQMPLVRFRGQVITHVEQHEEERLARAFGSHPLNRNHTMKCLLAENLAILGRTGFSCRRVMARASKRLTKVHGFISESLLK